MRRRAGCGASLSCPSTRTPCILRASWPLRFPRTPRSRAARPRARDPEPPLGTLQQDPRTSPQGWLSPQTSCSAAGSESHPQVIPRALAAAAAAAIRTGPSMHRAGRPEGAAPHTRGGGAGAARGPRLVPSRASRAPGLREGSWGAESRGAPPRPRSSPAERADARHQSPERRAPAETEAGRRGRDSPARSPPRGARAACQISGGQGRTTPPGVGGTIRALAPARRLSARSAPTPRRANTSEASGAIDRVTTSCLGERRRCP